MPVDQDYIRITNTGLFQGSSIFLSDIDGEINRNPHKKIQVYIPAFQTVDLLLTSRVLESLIQGDIKTFVDLGYLTVERFTPASASTAAVKTAVRTRHEPITLSEPGNRAPGQQPLSEVYGTMFALIFGVNTDSTYRLFKIPKYYVGNASFHVHWTKSDAGVDEGGKSVRWKLSYTVFNGNSENIMVSPNVIELEDTYDNAAADGSRIVFRTSNGEAPEIVANYYVGICVEAITPVGTPLVNDPALISLDLIYDEYINQSV